LHNIMKNNKLQKKVFIKTFECQMDAVLYDFSVLLEQNLMTIQARGFLEILVQLTGYRGK